MYDQYIVPIHHQVQIFCNFILLIKKKQKNLHPSIQPLPLNYLNTSLLFHPLSLTLTRKPTPLPHSYSPARDDVPPRMLRSASPARPELAPRVSSPGTPSPYCTCNNPYNHKHNTYNTAHFKSLSVSLCNLASKISVQCS